jgi:serine/threonine protein kinase
MSDISDKEKIGEGAYGIVYKGVMEKKNGDLREVAVKRNWGDKNSIGTSMIREMNFLKSINHPYITKCTKVSQSNPFSSANPLTPRYKGREMKEDRYLFVMEFMETDLEKYCLKEDSFYNLSTAMYQILLGMEYIHARGIMHRDLKPPNVLISVKDGVPCSKLCDFGLSCFKSNYRPATPGTVTSFYRAPEICCCYDDYSDKIDVWSAGCIFYEILTKRALFMSDRDTDRVIFKTIIKKLPQNFTSEYLTEYIKKGDIEPFKHGYREDIDKEKLSFETKITAKVDISKFSDEKLDLKLFCDLLDNMMKLNPLDRYTSTQALNHSYFNIFRKDHIDPIREKHVPGHIPDQPIKIIDCIERRWAVNISFKIFNRKDDLEWYNHHIVFHSLRLFDEYLARYYEKNKKREESTPTIGKLHTKVEVHLFFFTCIYMSYKYFTALYKVFSWKEIFPKSIVQNKSNLQKIINFENFLLRYTCKYVFFRPTLLEYLDRNYPKTKKTEEEKELDMKIFLYNYGNIDMDYEGTYQDLFSQIQEKRK